MAVDGLVFQNIPHALLVQGFEVEPVGGIEVGGDRLRVGVDHDALVAGVLQRPGGVHAAVVELDALPDADGPAADDHRLLSGLRRRLVLLLVGAVEIGRGGVELGGAGIHHLIDGPDVPCWRSWRTCSGSRSARVPICSSEKPRRLAARSRSGVSVSESRRFSMLRCSASCPGTRGRRLSVCQLRRLDAPPQGRHDRPQAQVGRRQREVAGSVALPFQLIGLGPAGPSLPPPVGSSQSSDLLPNSSERTAFCRAASKVRSMAITSPVAFICVPSWRSPEANLSKGQRGILTTM